MKLRPVASNRTIVASGCAGSQARILSAFHAHAAALPIVFGPAVVAANAKIPRRNDNHKQLIDQIDVWGGAAKLKPRILCGVYTYENNHDTKVKVSEARARAVVLFESIRFRLIDKMSLFRGVRSMRYICGGFV